MALNRARKGNDANNREISVGANVASGSIIIDDNDQVWVTLTDSGDSSRTQAIPGGGSITLPSGGAGNKDEAATAACDGSFYFEIQDSTDGETVEGTGTPAGTPVYYVDATTVSTDDDSAGRDFVGVIDDGAIVDGVGPVKIGVSI